MATDSNKKSAAGGSETVSRVKVGDDKDIRPSHARGFISPRLGKKSLFILLIIVILIGAWAILGMRVGQKVYAQVGSHKIYKEDVDNLKDKTKGITDRQAATVLADKYLTEAMAKEQKVTISGQDIETALGPDTKKIKSAHPYSYQLQVNQLYLDKLQANNRGIYKGDLLVAHFSRFISAQPVTPEDKVDFPQLDNPVAIASDKKYAQDFITELYSKIKSGKMTWQQAAEAERANPVVGEAMYPALSHSGPFNTSKAGEPLFTPLSVQDELRKLKAGQTSKPFVVKVQTTTRSNVESYFLVIHLDSKTGGQTVGFGEYIDQTKKQMGYKINV